MNVPFTFNGKEYRVSCLTLGDMSSFRNFLKRRKIELVRAAFTGTDKLVEKLQEAIATPLAEAEVKEGLDSLDGFFFLFHCSLTKEHPEIKFSEVTNLLPVDYKNFGLIMSAMMGENKSNPQTPPTQV